MAISWKQAVEIIQPHVVKITTPRGFGTGFLLAYNKDRKLCAIATANHVVEASHLWEEPIRILHYSSGKEMLLRADERSIWSDRKLDTAVILFFPKEDKEIPLPEKPLPFISKGNYLKVGVELGWVGFPVVSQYNLCFFTGKNSFWSEEYRTYLIDGVVINGVSGGPAFHTTTKEIIIIGSVSAYLPNRTDATPGLAMISDVEQYLDVIKTIKDLDEAKKGQEVEVKGSINVKSELKGKATIKKPKKLKRAKKTKEPKEQ